VTADENNNSEVSPMRYTTACILHFICHLQNYYYVHCVCCLFFAELTRNQIITLLPDFAVSSDNLQKYSIVFVLMSFRPVRMSTDRV